MDTAKRIATGLIDKVKALPQKYLMIGGAGLLALILVLVLVFSISTPLGLVGTGMKNSLKAIRKNPVIASTSGILDGGSIEVSADIATLLEAMGEYPLAKGNVSVKLFSDLHAKKAVVEAALAVDKGTELDASVFISENAVAVASDALLGKDSYGVGLKNFVENFNKSQFGEDGDYSLDIEIPEGVNTDDKQVAKLAKDSEKMAKKLLIKTFQTLKKNSTIDKEKSSLSFNGEETKTTAVSIAMDHKQIADSVEELIKYIRKDASVKKYIKDYAAYVLLASGQDPEDAVEFVEEFYEAIDEIYEDQLDELAENLEDEDFSVKLTFYISKSGKQLIGVEVRVESEYEDIKLLAYAGPDLKKVDEIGFRGTVDDETYRINYVVDTNDRKEYIAKLKVREDDYVAMEGSVTWDKKTTDFKVKLSDRWEEIAVNGTLEKSGKKTTILLKNINVDGDKMKLDTTIVLATSDKMPGMPKFQDVLKMSATEIETMIEKIGDTVQDLMMGGF